MILKFYRCVTCTRLNEERLLLKQEKCKCGGKKMGAIHATPVELFFFLIKHPSYILLALKEDDEKTG